MSCSAWPTDNTFIPVHEDNWIRYVPQSMLICGDLDMELNGKDAPPPTPLDGAEPYLKVIA